MQRQHLTVIRCHEGDIVEVVLDIGRLSVKNGDGGNATVNLVNLQPVSRVIHLGVPGFREREGETSLAVSLALGQEATR